MIEQGTYLQFEAGQLIQGQHEALRSVVEEACDGFWRVTRIDATSRTDYASTLATRNMPVPEYINTLVQVEYIIHVVRNGPAQGALHSFTYRAQLASNGKLYIKEAIPSFQLSR